jgi:predicted transcriptional regulator
MKFSEFVEENTINLTKFSKRSNVSVQTLWRLLSKKNPNITLMVAKKIVEGSKNKVSFLELANEVEEILKERRDKEREKEIPTEPTSTCQ